MKTVRELRELIESDSNGGADAGKLELGKTSLIDAYSYAKRMFKTVGRDFDKDIPNFKKNYKRAKKLSGIGYTKRKDMPVISSRDIKHLQGLFLSGSIDISPPFSPNTDIKKVIKGNIDKKTAKSFISNGLKIYDGDSKDDVVKAEIIKQQVGNLKPIQEQFSKSPNYPRN